MTAEATPTVSLRQRRVRADIEEFLYAEAALLDDRDFTAWLSLFAPDAHYWVPAGQDDADPTRDVSVVYDDMQFLAERVWRAGSGIAFAQEPASRTSHLVSNVRVKETRQSQAGELVGVTAAFIVTEFRREAVCTHAGRYRYELLSGPESFSILLKKVQLVNSGSRLGNLSVLL